eukprot:c41171_g1_i1 orf=3-728(-)
MIRRWAAMGLSMEARRAICRLSTQWQQGEVYRACVHNSSQTTLSSTEAASQVAFSLPEELAAGRDVGFTQNDHGAGEDLSHPRPAGWSPSEEQNSDFAAAEIAFAAQDEDDYDGAEYPISPRSRWRRKEETTQQTREVLQTGMLSKQLMKLPSHSPVLPSLQRWLAEGYTLSKNIVIVALTNLKREGRHKQASELAEFVWKERVYVMDDVDHMYRLYLMGQTGSIEDVEKCFASIPSKWLTE